MPVGKTAWNERLKLFAGLLHSAATTYLAVGLVAPLAASVYNPTSISAVPLTGVLFWALAVVLLHGCAQMALGRLRD
jgi:hypothetical protein